ncbi:hypothetical protein DUI87_11363 [Hirundo rustica rustica]|uniref:Uncharacterized protein n=1 Tax=Hirundo rustica rustica TaxID=333673 RepID=A0A3M0KDK1_HIRRU|nr:hypothetical protein DUI87_11363 [Hirundo rustica rustica]
MMLEVSFGKGDVDPYGAFLGRKEMFLLLPVWCQHHASMKHFHVQLTRVWVIAGAERSEFGDALGGKHQEETEDCACARLTCSSPCSIKAKFIKEHDLHLHRDPKTFREFTRWNLGSFSLSQKPYPGEEEGQDKLSHHEEQQEQGCALVTPPGNSWDLPWERVTHQTTTLHQMLVSPLTNQGQVGQGLEEPALAGGDPAHGRGWNPDIEGRAVLEEKTKFALKISQHIPYSGWLLPACCRPAWL